MTPHSEKVPTTPKLPRDAIIVLPGLIPAAGTTLSALARRLAVAFDNTAPSEASFRVAAERSMTLGSRDLRVITIMRHDGANAEGKPVTDVIEFDYRTYLTGALATSSPLRQAHAIAMTMLFNVRNLAAALSRPSQRMSQKMQVWLGALLFLIVAAYFGVLAYTVLASFVELIARTATQDAGHTSPATSLQAFLVPDYLKYLKTSIVGLTFAGLWSRLNLKAMLATVAPALSCTADYLAAGRRRSQILGELTRLIDHLDEQSETPYRHVHLLSYSFGSIVAIDALFPSETAALPKLKRIDTLITVGCPFDFVRTYWPGYFNARNAATSVPRRWLNIYCELDVLGSNFLDEQPSEDAKQRGIELIPQGQRRPDDQDNLPFGPRASEGRSLREYLRFVGFRTHSIYWDRESENALSCFEPIVQRLYEQELAA